MSWFIAYLGFSLVAADCPPPPSGALYGPTRTATFSADLCYLREPRRALVARVIVA